MAELLFLYALLGLALSHIAMGRMLRGNHNAPRGQHVLIGFLGFVTIVLWPIALLAYLNFLLGKKLHALYMSHFG